MIQDIEDALNTIVEGLGFPVVFPNTALTPTVNYLRVNYLGAQSEADTFGCDRLPSILQIDVVVKDGQGTSESTPMLNAVMAAFGKQIIIQNTTKVEIYREPYSSSSTNTGGWFYTSISIPFEVYK